MWRKTLPGFTLIELAVVLIIIGLIAGAVLKGQDLLETAKMRSVLSDISRYRLAVYLYQETYGALPGNDKNASTRFKDVLDGTGSGKLESDQEKQQFWVHLAKAGHVTQEKAPSSRMGGVFTVAYKSLVDITANCLILSGPNMEGLFTPRQAQKLKAKADDGDTKNGLIRFDNGQGSGTQTCLTQAGELNTTHDQPVCVLLVQF